ncbi:ester cyclase [Saccharopolyspora erythraea]|uniref:ester cyclase n=1 Tax=Saccharopolyspora erythraea TaxID=1836 RepID=UPI001BA48594|nr:ester cyclase [Saccharopolyspora erythraea]QUH01513.1 ester cyclase [Saccharopolyspora erythraea]
MTERSHRELWDCWSRIWNGEYELAYEVVSDGLRVNIPDHGMPDADTIHDPKTLTAWIAAFRSSFDDDARISGELGPFVVGDLALGRWVFNGVWQGGRPATATAEPGTPVTFRGVDILRFENGRIAEYWLTDDQLDLYAQLGAVPMPKSAQALALRAELSELPPEAGRARVLALVLDATAELLERDEIRASSGTESFVALGTDSVTAMALRTQLGESCGLALPATMVFDFPAPGALAGHLWSELAAELGGPEATALAALSRLEEAVAGLAGQDEVWDRIAQRLTALQRALAPAGDETGELDSATPEEMFALLDSKLGPAGSAG